MPPLQHPRACPLRSTPDNDGDCSGRLCWWWLHDMHCCAVTAIAGALQALAIDYRDTDKRSILP